MSAPIYPVSKILVHVPSLILVYYGNQKTRIAILYFAIDNIYIYIYIIIIIIYLYLFLYLLDD